MLASRRPADITLGGMQVRKLAAEVYGAHEQNGEWNEEGEWHVVGDEDLESSDDDLLGSDIESSSDDDEDYDDGDVHLVGDDSGSDGDYEDADDGNVPHVVSGEEPPCHSVMSSALHQVAQHCTLVQRDLFAERQLRTTKALTS